MYQTTIYIVMELQPEKKETLKLKFMRRFYGCAVEYETGRWADKEIEQTCFRELWDQVQRPAWKVLSIHQGLVDLTDEGSYYRLDKDRVVGVLYIPQ
jgi:hypothetical protein